MNKIIQNSLILLVFAVPLIFSHATTEVYGLIKAVALELGVLLLLVFWLGSIIFRDSPLRRSPITIGGDSPLKVGRTGWAILAFLAAAILSLSKAGNIQEAVRSIYQLGAGVGLFFLIINNLKEKKQVNAIILAMVVAAVFACFFSLYGNRGTGFRAVRFAYTSTFGNPIFFAQYLSFLIPISVAMCLQKKEVRIGTRAFFALAALFMLALLLLTRSRGAYLGLALAALYCYVVILLYSSARVRKLLIIGGVITSLALFSAGLVFSARLKGFSGENNRFRNLVRVYLWGSTLRMAIDNPILGVGAGNFKVVYLLYRSPKESQTIPKGVRYSQAHNDFLEIWAETGTLGLICFLGILLSLAPFILHPLAERRGPAAHICLGLCAGLITLLVQAFFNPLLSIPSSGMGFWILLGLITLTEEKK